MRRLVLLLLALLWLPALAAEDVDREIRRVEIALNRIHEEQQSVYQQFQMVQEMRRNEELRAYQSQLSYTPPATPPNYDDLRRDEDARAARLKEYQYELDRLYARYRELEDQKKPLLDELSALAQRRETEQ
jgi:hypothetical protein